LVGYLRRHADGLRVCGRYQAPSRGGARDRESLAALLRGRSRWFSPAEFEIRGVAQSPELVALLESRADTLAKWAGDDSVWESV
jgi:hypothetical protein